MKADFSLRIRNSDTHTKRSVNIFEVTVGQDRASRGKYVDTHYDGCSLGAIANRTHMYIAYHYFDIFINIIQHSMNINSVQ